MKQTCRGIVHFEKEKCQTKDIETEREQKEDFEKENSKKTKKGQKKGKEMDFNGGEDPRGPKVENRPREKRRGSLLWQHPEIPSTITEGAVLEVAIIIIIAVNIITMAIIMVIIKTINIITQSSIERSSSMQ